MEYKRIINSWETLIINHRNSRQKTGLTSMINHGICNTDNEIKFSSTMLSSSLCGCNDVQILVNRTITIKEAAVTTAARNSDASNKQAFIRKLCSTH